MSTSLAFTTVPTRLQVSTTNSIEKASWMGAVKLLPSFSLRPTTRLQQ